MKTAVAKENWREVFSENNPNTAFGMFDRTLKCYCPLKRQKAQHKENREVKWPQDVKRLSDDMQLLEI